MLAKAIILLGVTFSLLGFPQRIVSQEVKISEQSITVQIDHFAALYGVDGSLVKKIVQCESKGNEKATGDNGLAYGLFQYHKGSFERHAKLLGEELDYYSSYDQIKLGVFAISKGYGREWSSYRAIKNGGKYSFYSKLLKRNFVVYCKL